jgi:hypothetical protein
MPLYLPGFDGSYPTLQMKDRPGRFQYKYLVPIYVFPEMKLRGLDISKT